MIPPMGTFEYEAEFTSDGFRDREIVLHGTDPHNTELTRLVGLNPMIRFWNERLVIVAATKDKSTCRNASFPVGDAVQHAARAGDRLYIIRTGCGGIGLSLLRQQQLVLAAGAVNSIPLGSGIKIDLQPKSRESRDWLRELLTDTWLEFSVQSERLILREREVGELGNYHIYVERCWAPGIPGTDECVSLCVADDARLKIATMRSAILLGNDWLKTTSWDCTERFIPLWEE